MNKDTPPLSNMKKTKVLLKIFEPKNGDPVWVIGPLGPTNWLWGSTDKVEDFPLGVYETIDDCQKTIENIKECLDSDLVKLKSNILKKVTVDLKEILLQHANWGHTDFGTTASFINGLGANGVVEYELR